MGNELRTMYLCIHALQVAPVSCINRDDTGSPKNCIYGGTARMRVSSQCWKRAIRMYMKEKYADDGIRTKDIVNILTKRLSDECNCDVDQASDYVVRWLKKIGILSKKYEISSGKKKGKDGQIEESSKDTSAFFSMAQIKSLVELLEERYNDEKDRKKNEDDDKEEKKREAEFEKKLRNAVKDKPSVSELLFGRMFASNPDLDYDAACQVAHAFSVNEVYEEPDYFTVVPDIKAEGAMAGSDYLDTKLFNSGVLYRFADLNISEGSELRNANYKVDAAKVASQFLESFVCSMPKGSINAYANMTLPEIVVVELRDDVPVSFAPAFVKAIEGNDIRGAAIKEMTSYEDKISRLYGGPVKKWVLGEVSLKELCAQVESEINRRL